MLSLTSPVETPWHRIAPGVKLAVLAAFTFALFLTGDPALLAAALGLVMLAYALPGLVFLRDGVRRLRPLWPFVAVVLAWHALTGDLRLGLAICLRMLAAVGLANLVTMTTRLDALIALVTRLLRPFARLGLPVHALGLSVALVVRFVPVLSQKGALLAESWRSRSRRRPGWRIVVPMTLLALDDADHVAEALRARGGALPPPD